MDLARELYFLGLLGVAIAAYFLYFTFLFGAGYQPSPRRVVETMLRLAEVGPRDRLYDLGAGTGAIVFRAARVYRATVVGVEIDPFRVLILRIRRAMGTDKDRVTIHWGNLFDLPFSEATVVAVFLWPGAMERLKPILERELPPGARVVSHYHEVPGWKAEVFDAETKVYLHRLPERTISPDAESPTGGT
jgi:SAM-dependent methyltransferase